MRSADSSITFLRKVRPLRRRHAREIGTADAPVEDVTDEDEELVEKCSRLFARRNGASTSLLQRRLRLATRAARIVDILEQRYFGTRRRREAAMVDLDAAV